MYAGSEREGHKLNLVDLIYILTSRSRYLYELCVVYGIEFVRLRPPPGLARYIHDTYLSNVYGRRIRSGKKNSSDPTYPTHLTLTAARYIQ